jgi:hypothetical protein
MEYLIFSQMVAEEAGLFLADVEQAIRQPPFPSITS